MVAEAPIKRKVGQRGPEIPVMTKLKARTLYLNECLPAKVIAERCGLRPEQIDRMASKEGWTTVRKSQKERIIQKQDAQGDSLLKEAIESIRTESIELCKPALNSVRDGFETGGLNGAKQAQAASAALRNLASSFRALSESDGSENQPSHTLNMFFVGGAAQGLSQGQAQSEPKQVTEVGAK